MGVFRHSIIKCLDPTTAAKDTRYHQLKLTAKTNLANVFGMNQNMAFAA